MLVLTRKLGEGILIGDDVKVSIVEIKKGQVRIGIEANQEIPVYREEIYQKIKKENVKASESKPDDLKDILNILKISKK